MTSDIYAQMAEPLADGTWINTRIARLVEIINEYDPMLEVKWLSRDKRQLGEDVFQIVDTRINRVVFTVKDEASFDESVLTKIFKGDMEKRRGGPLTLLEEIDLENRSKKLLELKSKLEEEEERNEKIVSILKSPLNAYKHDGYRFDLHPKDQPKKFISTPKSQT